MRRLRVRRAISTACAAGGLLAAGVLSGAPAGAALAEPPARATATLLGPSGASVGSASLTATDEGLHIAVDVHGVEPGRHGIHLHVNGACAPGPDAAGMIIPFGAAGGHFDPGKTANHDMPDAPASVGHAGDIPNIEVGADGRGHLEYLNTDVTLLDDAEVVGRSIVLHADEDDYTTDPAGGSGPRIACGVITAQPASTTDRFVLPGPTAHPEGIAALPDGGFLVGSVHDGTIWRVAVDGEVSVFSPAGADGRTVATGMAVDDAGRVFVAGGATGTVHVLSADGTPLAALETPAADRTFLNGVAVSPDGSVYVTDSLRPVLFRIPVEGDDIGPVQPWLDLTTTSLVYTEGFNLNGIVVSESGSFLVAVQTNTGRLWRITTATGDVEEVDTAGMTFPAADGLALVDPEDGSDATPTLYVVQNASSTITRLALDPAGRYVEPTGQLVDANLRFPTSAAVIGDALLVVNGQLDRRATGTPVLPFVVSEIPTAAFDTLDHGDADPVHCSLAMS